MVFPFSDKTGLSMVNVFKIPEIESGRLDFKPSIPS
jgi:hypothetical protein